MTTQKPKISVLVPVYGAERFIGRCAVSLFEQTYDNLEFVFVDDCTKDRSIEVLEEVANRYPQRMNQLRIIRHDVNKGVGVARNTLLNAASGDFVLFVDPDDYVDITLAECLAEEQVKNDADVVLYDYKIITRGSTTEYKAVEVATPREYLSLLLSQVMPGYICGKMLRTRLFNDNHIRVEGSINIREDLMILIKALYYSRRISSHHGTYYYYDRRNENSITSGFNPQHLHDELWCDDNIRKFVSDKDKMLKEAAYMGSAKLYMQLLKRCALHNEPNFFYEVKQRSGNIRKLIKSTSKFFDRIILIMNYPIAHFYIQYASKIKKIYRKV